MNHTFDKIDWISERREVTCVSASAPPTGAGGLVQSNNWHLVVRNRKKATGILLEGEKKCARARRAEFWGYARDNSNGASAAAAANAASAIAVVVAAAAAENSAT